MEIHRNSLVYIYFFIILWIVIVQEKRRKDKERNIRFKLNSVEVLFPVTQSQFINSNLSLCINLQSDISNLLLPKHCLPFCSLLLSDHSQNKDGKK